EYYSLSNSYTSFNSDEVDINRSNLVYNYTLINFDKEISLREIASVCNLTPTYFCRYFKQMTNRTYNDFLTEVRIGHACRLLLENKLTTEFIGYECGFNNASNFFRQFRKLKGVTPLAYKNSISMPRS
ncbi:MAG TPA: AraC family transcriptional regulator, partial [Candidatus Dojkabacteria bacterium]|nr:AraC family transcriptional regulator [Candidatus Dojkabacteria bacterium]